MKRLKIGLIALSGFLAMSVASCSSADAGSETTTAENTAATQEEPAENKPKEWVEVYSFSGSGEKTSPTFHISSENAKLVYDYKSPMADAGIFNARVIKDGMGEYEDFDAAEVMVTKSESSESSIRREPGDYYIVVTAGGDWKVSVMEMK